MNKTKLNTTISVILGLCACVQVHLGNSYHHKTMVEIIQRRKEISGGKCLLGNFSSALD